MASSSATSKSAYSEPLWRKTTSGPILGFIDTHPLAKRSLGPTNIDGGFSPIRKWLGVTYGQAERFERATPPCPWIEALPAYEFGPAFLQPPSPFDAMYQGKKGWLTRHHLGQSEHAFKLNIFAPDTHERQLPVMVWIHGGNFVGGSSNEPIYDPTGLVRQQQATDTPVIMVSINYRLGSFGWLASPDLAAENGHVGNFALEWIQQNIENFGGDRNNVTAVGESAGAVIISILLNSGRKLFHKAIMESGNHLLLYQYPRPEYALYNELLQYIDKDLLQRSSHERVAALRALGATELHTWTLDHFYSGQWSLTTDPAEPGWSESLWCYVESGQRDPWIDSVIIGINRDEGTFFNVLEGNPAEHIKLLEYKDLMIEGSLTKLNDLYSEADAAADLANLVELPSTVSWHDLAYHTPMVHFAKSYSSRTSSSPAALPVYLYQCETLPKRLLEGFENYGVLHTGEIPFVLNNTALWDHDPDSSDSKTAAKVGNMWSTFAHGRAPWSAYTPERGEILYIRDAGETSVGDVHDIRPEYRDFWMSLYHAKYTNKEMKLPVEPFCASSWVPRIEQAADVLDTNKPGLGPEVFP